MNQTIKISLIAAALAAPAFLTISATTSVAGGVAERTSEEKVAFLSMVCADFNMLTRQGQGYCLQEMYGQSLEFAQSFFAAMEINANNKMQRIEEWRSKVGLDHPAKLTEEQKTLAETNIVYLIGYGTTCQQLSDTIMDPEQLLALHDKTVETIVGLPEYCVNQAISAAIRFDFNIDFDEAKQLSESISKVRHYYELSPEIPKPRAGEKIQLPNRV